MMTDDSPRGYTACRVVNTAGRFGNILGLADALLVFYVAARFRLKPEQ